MSSHREEKRMRVVLGKTFGGALAGAGHSDEIEKQSEWLGNTRFTDRNPKAEDVFLGVIGRFFGIARKLLEKDKPKRQPFTRSF